MALVASFVAAVAAHPAPALVQRCVTKACAARVEGRHRRAVIAPHRRWLRSVRLCESGGVYSTNTGNSFYGAYQFTMRSWRGVGGIGYPHRAEPLEQDYRAVLLLRRQGRGAWPVCG